MTNGLLVNIVNLYSENKHHRLKLRINTMSSNEGWSTDFLLKITIVKIEGTAYSERHEKNKALQNS